MNIFVLDYDPVKAAQMLCDKHVVKMPLETAQILCAAFNPGQSPYKRTHYNHPCVVWARSTENNFKWTVKHGLAVCKEYTFRYKKIHKSEAVILWCEKNIKKLKFKDIKKTRFVLCFDEKYHIGNAVESYREYYMAEKLKIAEWDKGRSRPFWTS